jgi:hypothetical protein
MLGQIQMESKIGGVAGLERRTLGWHTI